MLPPYSGSNNEGNKKPATSIIRFFHLKMEALYSSLSFGEPLLENTALHS
jgi:hypothetical protein